MTLKSGSQMTRHGELRDENVDIDSGSIWSMVICVHNCTSKFLMIQMGTISNMHPPISKIVSPILVKFTSHFKNGYSPNNLRILVYFGEFINFAQKPRH